MKWFCSVFVALLLVGCAGLPKPQVQPLPEPEVEYDDLFPNFYEESPIETLALSKTYADGRLRSEECRRAFLEYAGVDSAMLPVLGRIRVVFPSPWPFGLNVLAISTCVPQGISINSPLVYALGYVLGGSVWVHEIAHLALCDEKRAGTINHREDEQLAGQIERACVWSGSDISSLGVHHH